MRKNWAFMVEKVKYSHFGSQFKGPAGQHGALTVTQSIHSSLLAPVLGHTSLHTQCTPEIASYLVVLLQQTREMEAKEERVQPPAKSPV